MRETEILFFLLVVIMIRSRKTGSVTMISYLSSGFTYAKGANLILFFLADPRLGLVYLICFLLQVFLFLPGCLSSHFRASVPPRSVADPGSCAFLTPGSGFFRIPDL
jgi:hypothetical protein